jgi:hypothetical protein
LFGDLYETCGAEICILKPSEGNKSFEGFFISKQWEANNTNINYLFEDKGGKE